MPQYQAKASRWSIFAPITREHSRDLSRRSPDQVVASDYWRVSETVTILWRAI